MARTVKELQADKDKARKDKEAATSRLKKAVAAWKERLAAWRERHARLKGVKHKARHRVFRLRRLIKKRRSDDHFQPWMAAGHPYQDLSKPALAFIVRAVKAGQYITATYEGSPGDGVHTSSSLHYEQNTGPPARAVDAGAGSSGSMRSFYAAERRRPAAEYQELFGPGDSYVKNGVAEPGQFPGHEDHIHAAPYVH